MRQVRKLGLSSDQILLAAFVFAILLAILIVFLLLIISTWVGV